MAIEKKVVLYLRTDIYNQTVKAGGSVSHTLGVINGFLAQGFSVVVASSIMQETVQKLPLTGFIHLKNPSWLGWLRRKLNCVVSNIFFSYQVLRSLPKNKPILLYQRYSILNCTGITVSKLKKIPLMLEYNGSEAWVDAHWSKKDKIIRFSWLINCIEKLNIQHADFITVVSQALKNELISRGVDASKIIVNCNGVDTNQFDQSRLINERQIYREKLGLQENFVFGFVGTFSAWHGINVLAHIIPPLLEKYNNVRFLLIGDGPQRPWLEQQLDVCLDTHQRKKIMFTGIIAPEYIPEYLASCDGFLCPTQPNPDNSEFFGSPTKLFEYLSMAKPIIASRIGQIEEIIYPAVDVTKSNSAHNSAENATGILVNPIDNTEFIAAIEYILQAPQEQLQRIGACARKKAETEYQWTDHVKRIIAFTQGSV